MHLLLAALVRLTVGVVIFVQSCQKYRQLLRKLCEFGAVFPGLRQSTEQLAKLIIAANA